MLALLSALVWGSGDFAGGLATRRADPVQVLAWSAVSGMILLVALALVTREPLLPATAAAWAIAGGLSAAIGITFLYRGLAVGRAATVAPAAAVVTAALPVLFTAITQGLPQPLQIFGFVLAVIGIWLVARTPDPAPSAETAPIARQSSGLALALAAGTGFGGFLILIAHVPEEFVFLPLTIARLTMLAAAVVVLFARGLALPPPLSNPIALVAGTLDAGGNIFYVVARRYARLDVAAVLSSLYPVATVLLAWLLLRERMDRRQWLGAAVCCVAVLFIAA
jgi:uncharacterized membrane protein